MNTESKPILAECPECDGRLRFRKNLKIGELILCPECEVTLEVVSIKPLELGWADDDPWDFEDFDQPRFQSGYRIS